MGQHLGEIAQARFLVAALGEIAAPPWWRSQAHGEVQGRWLERLFPRTAASAALEVSGRAARLEHDARLGRMGVYHLFRLPPALEVSLHEALRGGRLDLASTAALKTPDERFRALAQLAGNEPVRGAAGPVSCGPIDALERGRALQRLCAAYAGAFQAGTATYPYLETGAAG